MVLALRNLHNQGRKEGRKWQKLKQSDQIVNTYILWWFHWILITNHTWAPLDWLPALPALSLSCLVTHQLSPAATPALPIRQAPSWPFCQPLLILHLEFMPSFTCKWGPGKEQLHPTLESLVSPALQWPLHQKQATSHQRFLFRPTYCRNERGKTLGKVFHCLFLCLQPVSESNLDLLQRQGADYWSAPSHPTHCHGQIQPTAVIPTPTQPFQVSTKTNGMLPTTSSPSSCPCVQELGWRLSWFNKLKFMDPWLG